MSSFVRFPAFRPGITHKLRMALLTSFCNVRFTSDWFGSKITHFFFVVTLPVIMRSSFLATVSTMVKIRFTTMGFLPSFWIQVSGRMCLLFFLAV